MEYRRLGTTDFTVSALCLGTMQFGWTADKETSLAILTAAYEAGINFVDTANIYSKWVAGNQGGEAETIIGEWLKQGVARREDLVLATKVRGRMWEGPDGEGLSRAHIQRGAEDSLKRMGIEAIDLYQLHYPDPQTPIEETLEALDSLVRSGKVRAIGCSNFRPSEIVPALGSSEKSNLASFVSVQPHYNLVHRQEFESELKGVCEQFGLAVLPYSPLGGGFLTGKYTRDHKPPAGSRAAGSQRIRDLMGKRATWEALEVIIEIAQARGNSASQVSLAWLLGRPGVTSPIIGPRSLEQLEDNLGATDLKLGQAELQRLEEVSAET